MASPSPRIMLLLAMVIVAMVFPSPGASVCETSAPAACVPTIHDPHARRWSANLAIPHSCLQRQQQQHRRRQHQSPVFAAFAVVQRPRLINVGDPSTRVRVAPRAGRVALALSTSWYSHARCESRGFCHPRSRFTVLGASKSKRKPKKNKAGSNRANGGGGGGFGGAAPAALVQPTTVGAQRAPPTSTSPTAAAAARSVATGGELPDDDFATFPPLSADMLKSVMGVDVFDLPPRGIPASERGQEQALPAQVLQCIRKRHGLEEFAGGRRLLDPEYGNSDDETAETASTSASASVSDDGGASPVRGGLLFPGLRLLHAEPPVIGVDDFFSSQECDEYISRSLSPPPPTPASAAGGTGPHKQRSATLGADVDAVAQRTSTTWFHRFSAVPELMAKASALVGVPFEEGRWEEAQTVRYRPGEKFTWHLDALPPSPELASKGGQRIATLLVYLTDMPEGDGGATAFRDLGPLRVRPRKGSALLFFPSCGGAPDCPFDVRTLHAGEMVRPGTEQDKWIAQLWLRESRYTPTVPKQNRHADAESVVAKFDKSWRAS